MKTYQGIASGVRKPIIGEVCREDRLFGRKGKILVSPYRSLFPLGYRGVVTNRPTGLSVGRVPTIQLETLPADIMAGDCLSIFPDGKVSMVWKRDNPTNSILLTEKCNCRCLMCPQPPKPHEQQTYDIAVGLLDILDPNETGTICITGGEPTLLGENFLGILRIIRDKFPNSDLMVLTNGKTFSDYQFTKEYSASAPARTITCVSLHSDIEKIHDKIVNADGSFTRTVQGLYNLASMRMKIELRHVINRINADRLKEFSNFAYRNFPFCYHFALMGMEITGLATKNFEQIWIDPADYSIKLDEAAWQLHRTMLHVSIYNIPLCLLQKRSWFFARQSISRWKNDYLPICDTCTVKKQCAGIFATSGDRQSPKIKPVVPTAYSPKNA